MAAFNETRASSSKKYVAGQGVLMPNCSKTFQTLFSHSIFALEKQLKNLYFHSFLPIRDPLVRYFQ